MKKKLLVLLCVTTLGMSMALTGCGKDEPVEKKAEVTEEKKEEELIAIGEEKDSEYQVKVTNKTGKTITAVSVKSSDETEYPVNMMAEGDVFKAEESRLLCYTAPEPVANPDAAPTDKVLTPAYDVQLTYEDGTIAVLHGFPFGDIDEGELFMEEVAYIKYTSVATKSQVDTKGTEEAIKTQEEEKAKAEAEAKAQAEAEAAAAAAAAEAAAQTYTEEYYYEEPSYDAGYDSGATGGDDACLNGGLTY